MACLWWDMLIWYYCFNIGFSVSANNRKITGAILFNAIEWMNVL